MYNSVGGIQGLYGLVRIILPSPGFDPRTVQAVASRYTDCANPAHFRYSITPYSARYAGTDGIEVHSFREFVSIY
jgi:hypothetical protein